jgi:hypothetical protein
LQDLSAEEAAVLALLESRLDQDARLIGQLKASVRRGAKAARPTKAARPRA